MSRLLTTISVRFFKKYLLFYDLVLCCVILYKKKINILVFTRRNLFSVIPCSVRDRSRATVRLVACLRWTFFSPSKIKNGVVSILAKNSRTSSICCYWTYADTYDRHQVVRRRHFSSGVSLRRRPGAATLPQNSSIRMRDGANFPPSSSPFDLD